MTGVTITADEFKARLDEQSPFIRARYSTLERKKEFLDNLIRFEVLAREAEKQGLAKDPDVQMTLKKIMVQKLVQKNFQDLEGAKDLPEAELQKYYDEHKADYFRPKRVRVAAVVWNAPAGSPERAKKLAAAKKALAKIKAEEKKNPLAFAQAVAQHSEDPASKGAAGDLQFKSHEELEQAYSKELADAAFALKPGETSGVVETPKGAVPPEADRRAGGAEPLLRPGEDADREQAPPRAEDEGVRRVAEGPPRGGQDHRRREGARGDRGLRRRRPPACPARWAAAWAVTAAPGRPRGRRRRPPRPRPRSRRARAALLMRSPRSPRSPPAAAAAAATSATRRPGRRRSRS